MTFKRVEWPLQEGEWPLKDILNKASKELPAEDVQLYTALVEAILDEKKTPDLENTRDGVNWTRKNTASKQRPKVRISCRADRRPALMRASARLRPGATGAQQIGDAGPFGLADEAAISRLHVLDPITALT